MPAISVASKASIKSKNKFGQYFTPAVVADFMLDLATVSKEASVLEPSCGEGVFLDLLAQRGFSSVIGYELDTSLATQFPNVRYESFVSAEISEKFDLIIGNPPYIRWGNLEEELKKELLLSPLWNRHFNSLCDYLYIFILKSIELLRDGGELIFVCPEYWMNTTHSVTLRNYMMANGYFECIYHFNETPIFDKATVSVVVFKYIKSKSPKSNISVCKYHTNQKLKPDILQQLREKDADIEEAEYLTIPQFRANERWLLTTVQIKNQLQQFEKICQKPPKNAIYGLFEDIKQNYDTIGDVCDIGNGLVSGLDKAFQLNGHSLNAYEEEATLKVIKAKDLRPFYHEVITNYIFVSEKLAEKDFSQKYPSFFEHLQNYKSDLTSRYQYNREIQYWEWVFLRNFNLFSRKEKRIFVPCKERISNKNHFRFALVNEGIFPTQDVTALFRKTSTKESIEYILAFLNQPHVFEWLKYNGIVKGNIVEFSEKPLASIPFKKINWDNPKEVELHRRITTTTQEYIETQQNLLLSTINALFNELLKNILFKTAWHITTLSL